jgi:hypothetical protein
LYKILYYCEVPNDTFDILVCLWYWHKLA